MIYPGTPQIQWEVANTPDRICKRLWDGFVGSHLIFKIVEYESNSPRPGKIILHDLKCSLPSVLPSLGKGTESIDELKDRAQDEFNKWYRTLMEVK